MKGKKKDTFFPAILKILSAVFFASGAMTMQFHGQQPPPLEPIDLSFSGMVKNDFIETSFIFI